jgi:hypothetical protein
LLSIEKEEKAPCIWVYKNVFDSKNFCELIEKETQKEWPLIDWFYSNTGDGEQTKISEYRTSLEMPMDPFFSDTINEDLKSLQNLFIEDIFSKIDECIWDYRECFDLNLNADSGYHLLKYIDGGEYHIHHDHSSKNGRVLSLVACLGDDFDGGELEFNNFDLTIKLDKNSLVLFPSNFPYTHIAHPVKSGVKYSLVTWFV